MDDFEFYNKHYARIDDRGRVTYIWSDGPLPHEPTDGAVCINEKGSYQVYLTINGVRTQENPGILDDNGIPLYKWDGEAIHKRTEEEIAADRAKLPPPAPSPMEVMETRVNEVSAAASIAFVVMAEAGQIDDVTVGEHAGIFAEWAYPVSYAGGQIRRYGDKLYRCVQAHTSQADWTPDAAVSLWTAVADPTEEWPAWSQPLGAHDAYGLGDKVSHNGERWTSDADNNVWEPGVYGWTRAE